MSSSKTIISLSSVLGLVAIDFVFEKLKTLDNGAAGLAGLPPLRSPIRCSLVHIPVSGTLASIEASVGEDMTLSPPCLRFLKESVSARTVALGDLP